MVLLFYNLPHLHSPDILHTHWTFIIVHTLHSLTINTHSLIIYTHTLIIYTHTLIIYTHSIIIHTYMFHKHSNPSHNNVLNCRIKLVWSSNSTRSHDKHCSKLFTAGLNAILISNDNYLCMDTIYLTCI